MGRMIRKVLFVRIGVLGALILLELLLGLSGPLRLLALLLEPLGRLIPGRLGALAGPLKLIPFVVGPLILLLLISRQPLHRLKLHRVTTSPNPVSQVALAVQ